MGGEVTTTGTLKAAGLKLTDVALLVIETLLGVVETLTSIGADVGVNLAFFDVETFDLLVTGFGETLLKF